MSRVAESPIMEMLWALPRHRRDPRHCCDGGRTPSSNLFSSGSEQDFNFHLDRTARAVGPLQLASDVFPHSVPHVVVQREVLLCDVSEASGGRLKRGVE